MHSNKEESAFTLAVAVKVGICMDYFADWGFHLHEDTNSEDVRLWSMRFRVLSGSFFKHVHSTLVKNTLTEHVLFGGH